MAQKIKDSSFYHSKIKDWPENERPREKLLKYGCDKLTDAELLAILIQEGTTKITALDIAKSLLIEFKDLNTIASKELKDFKKHKGIGLAKGLKLLAAFELSRRIASQKVSRNIKITNPSRRKLDSFPKKSFPFEKG